MSLIRSANLALKFALELAAIAAFAYWGSTLSTAGLAVLVAIVTPGVAIALWAVFCAPRSSRRLPMPLRAMVELAIFGLAALALVAAGEPVLAAVFAACTMGNAALLTKLHQWDG
jgi:hypothetical protein